MLLFYRTNNLVVEKIIDIDRVGYANFKYIMFFLNYYYLLFLIYFCLHMYQNPRIHTSLIYPIIFYWLNRYQNELYVTQDETDTYDLKKIKIV